MGNNGKIAELVKLSMLAVFAGFCLLGGASWSERPTYEWDPEDKRLYDEWEAKAYRNRVVQKQFEEYRERTGDDATVPWEKQLEKRWQEESGKNPYHKREVQQPRQTELRAVAWFLIVGGFAGLFLLHWRVQRGGVPAAEGKPAAVSDG